MDDELYRITPFLCFSMGDSSEVLYSLMSKRTLEVARGTSGRLHRLRTAEPLSAYTDTLSAVTSNPADLIQTLLEASILVSPRHFLNSCIENSSEPSEPARISCLATPTHGRSQLLPLTFGSYLANLRKNDRAPDILIADDSAEEVEQCATLNAVKQIVQSAGRPIVYTGTVEKLSFLKALANECAAPEAVLSFALLGDSRFPVTTGANRNGILLYSAGLLLLTVDDDSCCNPVYMPDKGHREFITLGGESPGAWKTPERIELSGSDDSVSWSIVGEHERFLGKPLPRVVAEHWAKLRLNRLSDRFLVDLSKATGQVIATFTGVAGDPGMRSSAPIAMLRQYEPKFEMDSEEQYTEDLELRELVRHFQTTTICRNGFSMTTAVGLDHRVLLPPFLPICRNQDGLFVAVLRRIQPQGYFAHLPFALMHKPSGMRKNDPTWTSSTRIADQIIEYVAAWPEPVVQLGAEERCTALGNYLIGISSMRQPEFEEMTRVLLLRRASRLIRDCEMAMARYSGQPGFWVRDLCDRITEIRSATIRADFAVPCDLRGLLSLESIHNATQQLVRQFGELLCWWPEVVKASRSLAEGGVRLGRKIRPN